MTSDLFSIQPFGNQKEFLRLRKRKRYGGSLKFLRFYWNSAFVQQFFANFHRVMVKEKPAGKVEQKKNGQNRYHNNLVRFVLKRESKFFFLRPFKHSNQWWWFVLICLYYHATFRNSARFSKMSRCFNRQVKQQKKVRIFIETTFCVNL